MKNAEIKQYAKSKLKGNLVTVVAILIIQGVITAAVAGLTNILSVIILPIVAGPLAVGACRCMLSLSRGEKVDVAQVFDGFRTVKDAALLHFMRNLLVFLWSLLLVVPGIIAGYSYSMVFFIMADNPGITYGEALEKSKKSMYGNRMKLFMLQLSFFGWMLLVMVTFGLAAFYVTPYFNMTLCVFYNQLIYGNPEGRGGYLPPENAGQYHQEHGAYYQAPVHYEKPVEQKEQSKPEETSFAGATTLLSSPTGNATTVLSNVMEKQMGLFSGFGNGLAGKIYSLEDGQVYYVGRESTQCGILVEDEDGSVSRCHCAIQYIAEQGSYYVTDFSSNGTFVNGERIPQNQPILVHAGDTVMIGARGNGFKLG